MKMLKLIKKYPFLFLIILSIQIFSVIGFIGKNTIYADYSIKLIKTPQLAVVFEGVGEGKYPWEIGAFQSDYAENKDQQNDISKITSKDIVNEDINNIVIKDLDRNASDGSGVVNKKMENKVNTRGDNSNTNKDDTNTSKDDANKDDANKDDASKDVTSKDDSNTSEGDNGINISRKRSDTNSLSKDKRITKKVNKEEKIIPQFQKVGLDYFDDALFIGDSRTVGLSEYSGWNNSTFYADVGLTIYDVFNKNIAEVDGQKITIEEALVKNQFRKIYIMVGINELGRGTTDTFITEYKKVVQKIQQMQPNAIIFVEGIMNVAKEKSDTDPIFNNKNIKDKNEHLALLADNNNIFYIDVNEVITDKTGSIPKDYTFDNIHLKAVYYKIWTDFLRKHGIVKENE